MAGKRNGGYVAYREDGTTFTFTHPVDYRTAIKQGSFFAKNPLAPVEKKKAIVEEIEMEHEIIEGIEEVKSNIPASGLNIVDETDGIKKRTARRK